MSDLQTRRLILQSLLHLDRPIETLTSELAKFAWDDAPDLVTLKRTHVAAILHRFKNGEISSATVEQWSDAIEMRDDINVSGDERLMEAIFVLANPVINGKLDHLLADKILASISD